MLRRAEATCTVALPRERAFAVLTDYRRLPRWIGPAEVAELAREGDVVVLEVRAPRYRTESVVFEILAGPPSTVRFSQVGKLGRPDVAGSCALEDAEGGCRLAIRLRVRTPLWGSGRRRLVAFLNAALQAFAEGAAEASGDSAVFVDGKCRLFEISRHGDDLELAVAGRRYRLVEAVEDEP